MKNYKYIATADLISLSACDDKPKPSPVAQSDKGSQAIQIAIPEGGIDALPADIELINAVKNNNLRRAKAVLENDGAKVSMIDENGITALMLAAASKNPKMLETLLNHTKSGDSIVLDRGDLSGKSAMTYAVESNSPEMVIMLRRKGANTNIFDTNQNFPLLLAAKSGNQELVNSMLKEISGTVPANPNLQNLTGDTALIAATIAGSLETIKLLKDYGANINSANTDGITPLIYAVKQNNTQLFDYLLTLGADINDVSTSKSPLIHALENKNYVFALHIIEKGGDVNAHAPNLASPIQTLVSQENADPVMVAKLISSGAKLSADGETPSLLLSRAIRKGNAPVVELLIKSGLKVADLETTTNSGLLEALKTEDPAIALLMIKNGANYSKPNEEGLTPLAIAAKKNYKDVFLAIVKSGADVNQIGRNKSTVPLEIVVENDNAELLQIMFDNGLKANTDALLLRAVTSKGNTILPVVLAHGAKPNIMNTAGQPALWLAIARDDTTSAKTLVEAGASTNVQDKERGITPLSLSIARANIELATYLLEKGANPQIADNSGFTSLTYAVVAGQSEMVKLLVSKGAEVKTLDGRGKSLQEILAESKINPQKKQEIQAILAASGLK